MILVDMNQFVISNIMVLIRDDELDENYLRFNLIKNLKEYKRIYKEYGDLVLAFDSKSYWRRDFFQYYKHNRKKERKKSDIDWDVVHSYIRQFKKEFEENLEYIVLEILTCEADDVIAVISKLLKNNLIISDDKDFLQLLLFDNTNLLRPRKNEFIKNGLYDREELQKILKEHIIRGDRSDGIPNILSPDESLAEGIRQKAITKKFLEKHLLKDIQKEEDFYDKYLRNKRLIDLSEIPQVVETTVLKEFKKQLKEQNRVNNKEYFENHNILSLYHD